MLAGTTAQLTGTAGTSEEVPSTSRVDAEARSVAAAPRGGVIWITSAAAVARADLVGVVRRQLETRWAIRVFTPERLDAWLATADDETAAIVVSSESATAANARFRVGAAGRAFAEIQAVSDWDALVERSDSSILEHVAEFFAQLGHVPRAPAPRNRLRQGYGGLAEARSAEAAGAPDTTRRRPRRAAPPEAIIRLDWHGPRQIEQRVADALKRARLERSGPDSGGTAEAVPSTGE